MKKSWRYLIVLVVILVTTTALYSDKGNTGYKCLIQLKNYQGEGAYMVVSIVDKEWKYVETVHVSGDDHEWYPDLQKWWKYRGKNRHQPRLDGVTGSTIGNGERTVISIELKDKFVDNGYQLRFETAVEDKTYHKEDVSIDLSSTILKAGKFTGKAGYIRLIRLIPLSK